MITFTVPGLPIGKQRVRAAVKTRARRPHLQKASDPQIEESYLRLGAVKKVGLELGMCPQSVHERLTKMGVKTSRDDLFSEEERERILRDYVAYADAGKLKDLAKQMGRTAPSICRIAGKLGLTDQRRARPYIAEGVSVRTKAWLADNEHPRGMSGKQHTEELKRSHSTASRARWSAMTEDQKAEHTMKQMKAKVQKYGTLAVNVTRGNWKSGWREIGAHRRFFRSAWEANYARYLEWLRVQGQIADWVHEPDTFWFEAIKRGVRSYLPDFKVTELNGSEVYHEVKGWMDAASKTKIRRMAKYHPKVKLLVIDAKQYRAIAAKVSAIVDGWE